MNVINVLLKRSALRSLHRESAARDVAAAVQRKPERLVTHAEFRVSLALNRVR